MNKEQKPQSCQTDVMLSLPDIRNKLSPITNLIAMLENGLVKGNVEMHDLVLKEIEQCKKSIAYLSGNGAKRFANKYSSDMKEQIYKICTQLNDGQIAVTEATEQLLDLFAVSGSLRFSEREVDFAYLCGVFNTSGIDGLHSEIQRLKELGKEPHDIIEACRKQ